MDCIMNFDLCSERTLTVGAIIINPWMFMQIQIFKSTTKEMKMTKVSSLTRYR